MDRNARGWLRTLGFAGFAGLVGIVAGGVVASCVVRDPEYCTTSDACPTFDTDMGAVHLLCDSTRHVCIPRNPNGSCSEDAECRDFKYPRCDTSDQTCKSCRFGDDSDKSCAQRSDGRRLCVNAADGSGTLCVACQVSLDCPKENPICDNQVCRKCSSHSDCEGKLICDNGAPCTDSLVCIYDGDLTADLVGRCAQNGSSATTGRVIYVNSAIAAPDGITNPGTEFSTAVNNLLGAMKLARDQSRRFIRLVGTLKDAPGIDPAYDIKAGALSFIGAPVRGSKMATIEGRNTLFQVTGVGSLTFDQVMLVQGNADSNSVTCSGTSPPLPSLTLRSSILTGSTMPLTPNVSTYALSITNCKTILDGNIIGLNNTADLLSTSVGVHGGAILIADTTSGKSSALVQNNIIAGNAGIALRLFATGGSNFVFRFNTIYKNGRGQQGKASGIYCPDMASTLEFSHSIVVGNSMAATTGGSQFAQGRNCNLKDVVVGTDEMGTDVGNVIRKNPILDPDFRLHQSDANSDCCIDKVTPGENETLPAFDVDGNSRPLDTKWDIGASEYKKQ